MKCAARTRSTIFFRLAILAAGIAAHSAAADSNFKFGRDTFPFANETVEEYQEGLHHARTAEARKAHWFNRRCFVLSRATMQFHKFARFDPNAPPLDDRTLAARIRTVMRRSAWRDELPENQRTIFPYRDLRTMCNARREIVQRNVGLGWPTFLRPGNFRMFYERGRNYQEKTHAHLDETLDRGGLFAVYLSTYPNLSINHTVLVYARKSKSADGKIENYLTYDPNHPEAPRIMTWSDAADSFSYQKDWDFVGGPVRAYQVYGKLFQ